jgi:UDP-GlcNAc:polypeptide alpha-N-acetylglucosaminyltransferase
MISFSGAEEVPISDMPYQTPYVAAGFIFANSSFLNELPFDPYLPNLFVGEEILLSIRFWTNGWDIYSPNTNIVFHKYTRKDEPHVWDDNKFDDRDAFAKVKNIIGLSNENIPEVVNKQIEIYGLGNVRKLEEYYKFANIDIKNKKVKSNYCRKNNIDDTIEKFTNSIDFSNLIIPRTHYEKFEQKILKTQNKSSFFKNIIFFILFLFLLLLILNISKKSK